MSSRKYLKNWDPTQHYQNDWVANTYDNDRFKSLSGRVFNALEKRLIRKAFNGTPKQAAVVDIPCGTGRLAQVLLEEGFEVTGVDISAQMLAVAEAKLSRFGNRFRIVVSDVRSFAGQGMLFDATLCARALMHFPLTEQVDFLRSLVSLTRDRIVFTQGLNTRYHRLRRCAKRFLGHTAPAAFPVTPHELRLIMDEAELIEVKRYHVFPLLSESVVIVAEPKRRYSGIRGQLTLQPELRTVV